MLLDAERQVEIFGRAAVPAADAPQEVAAEDAERAGDVVHEIEGIEARAAQVYRERVLEGLQARHEAAAGVAGAQVPRHRDDVLIGEVPYGVPHHVVVEGGVAVEGHDDLAGRDRKSTRLNSSHSQISYAVFCLKKKNLPRFASVAAPMSRTATRPSRTSRGISSSRRFSALSCSRRPPKLVARCTTASARPTV